MRRDIAKLLETGQEATARIRVEHIIREENMMAAQEIIELFCELISVRLPIIESQRECPLDLKEAISSVCFAAPRCADLPELLQVQMLFAGKYGKEFLSAATELRPDCGVNRQLIELLSIRAPSAEKKLNLLKEIAVEHDLDWDPAASETEFFKKHEDLLNGPTQFFSGSKLPLPDEKHNAEMYSAHDTPNKEQPDSDSDSDTLEFPEVPKASVQPNANVATAPAMNTPLTMLPLDVDLDSPNYSEDFADVNQDQVEDRSTTVHKDEPHTSIGKTENKQFVPFIAPPTPGSFSARHSDSSPSLSSTKSETNVDLQDVLAAAHAAAETAERAAAAARSAASLAQVRINELTKKKNTENVPNSSSENPFYAGGDNESPTIEKHFTEQNTVGNSDGHNRNDEHHQDHYASPSSHSSTSPSFDTLKEDFDSSPPNDHDKSSTHQPKRLPSMDDDTYFSYPNLFTSQNSNVGSQTHSDNGRSSHDL
ncbi:IST1-like protein, partial [Mucuna pruriens]